MDLRGCSLSEIAKYVIMIELMFALIGVAELIVLQNQ